MALILELSFSSSAPEKQLKILYSVMQVLLRYTDHIPFKSDLKSQTVKWIVQ